LTNLGGISHNVPVINDVFFAPDKKKCGAFLRAQKNVAEKKSTKALAPTEFFRSLAALAAYINNPVRRSRKALFNIVYFF
jgi:hypothetical protein